MQKSKSQLKPLKISEHPARKNQEALNFNGSYVRTSDRCIILVENDKVAVSGQMLKLEARDDHVYLGEYFLINEDAHCLTWGHEDLMEPITWVRGDDDKLRSLLKYTNEVASSLPSPEFATPPRARASSPTAHPYSMNPIESVDRDQKPQARSCDRFDLTATDLTVADVNAMVLPPLNEIDLIGLHISQIESLAVELGIIVEGECDFQIVPALRIVFIMKFLETLRDLPGPEQTVRQNMRLLDYDWTEIKEALLRNFCGRSMMRTAYRRRLSELRFEGPAKVENFITKASLMVSIAARLYGDSTADLNGIVRDVLSKLTHEVRTKVAGKLMQIAETDNDDWETTCPFDDLCGRMFKRTKNNDKTVVSLIRRVCNQITETQSLGSDARVDSGYTNMTSNTPTPSRQTAVPDRARRVQEGPRGADDWVNRQTSVFYVSGRECADVDATIERLTQAGFREHRLLPANVGFPRFLVGSHLQRDEADACLSSMRKLGYLTSDFQSRSPFQKNV